jgi:transposase-like protein
MVGGMRQRLSKAGDRSGGALACPKCGGTTFKAKRSFKGKLLGGFLLAPKSRVKCEACGTQFKRG